MSGKGKCPLCETGMGYPTFYGFKCDFKECQWYAGEDNTPLSYADLIKQVEKDMLLNFSWP